MSTIQNTRFADAHGSHVMTCSTNAMNGAIPVDGAQRPDTRAWCAGRRVALLTDPVPRCIAEIIHETDLDDEHTLKITKH